MTFLLFTNSLLLSTVQAFFLFDLYFFNKKENETEYVKRVGRIPCLFPLGIGIILGFVYFRIALYFYNPSYNYIIYILAFCSLPVYLPSIKCFFAYLLAGRNIREYDVFIENLTDFALFKPKIKVKKEIPPFVLVNPLETLTETQQIVFDDFKRESQAWKEPSFTTDECLYRFLKAKKWNFTEAKNQILDAIKWRREFQPEKITKEECSKVEKMKYIFHHGFDRKSRPILYLMLGNDTLPNTPENRLLKFKFLVYNMELCQKNMLPEVTSCCFVIDLKNANITFEMIDQMKEMFGKLGNAYPERLGQALITNVSWGLSGIWYLVQGMLSEETAKKFQMISAQDQEMLDDFEEHIDPKVLIKEFYGQNEYNL